MSSDDEKTEEMIRALMIGYAMSRLDRTYLEARGLKTWKEAYEEAGLAVGRGQNSIKNLRDAFDPLHGTKRGWWQRPMIRSRRRVAAELCDVSDQALLALVDRVIGEAEADVDGVVAAMTDCEADTVNVAERLLTGRRAEAFF